MNAYSKGLKSNIEVVYKDISELTLQKGNPRSHPKKQIKQLAKSIERFGFITPILIDTFDEIIAGHGRVEAAKMLGRRQVPTVRIDHLTEAEIRTYRIADNKLAENAEWNEALLVAEFKMISLEPNFDLTLTGFEMPKIDLLLFGNQTELTEADQVPEIDETEPAISKPGDLWRIGKHLLFCGDATKPDSFERLLGQERAQIVFTDPPYNVRIDGHVSGLGKNKHAEFAMATGEMTEEEFTAFLEAIFQNLADYSVDGSLHYLCMDWRHMNEMLSAAEKPYAKLENLCVWNKTNGGMGSFYRSKHELVFVFKKGSGSHINNVDLGTHGRYRTNVWDYPGVNTFGKTRDSELAMHPTVKPIALVADAILDASERGAIVLDACAGSGTTLLAAQKTGRRGYGIEFSAHYVDTIIKRFSDTFGIEAVLDDTGVTFADERKERELMAKFERAIG